MWIFSPSGLLMPGLVPVVNGKSVADATLTRNGEFELQVRGRVRSHLQFFIEENFIPLGLEYSDIEATPNMDYNFRFYTTRANLAAAVANQVLAIDYVKYKEQSERRGVDGKPMYPEGRRFHDVLTRAWSLLTDLNPAGGWYAPRTADNPRGYTPSARGRSSQHALTRGSVGSYVTASDSLLAGWDPDFDEWQGRQDGAVEAAYAKVEGIPEDQWEDFLTQDEYALLQAFQSAWGDYEPEHQDMERMTDAELDTLFDGERKPAKRGRQGKSTRKSAKGRKFFGKK